MEFCLPHTNIDAMKHTKSQLNNFEKIFVSSWNTYSLVFLTALNICTYISGKIRYFFHRFDKKSGKNDSFQNVCDVTCRHIGCFYSYKLK